MNTAPTDSPGGELEREINEELFRERMSALWKRYGIFVAGAAVALVVGVAGYQIWQARILEKRDAASVQFMNAGTLAQTDHAAAEQAFKKLAENAPPAYAKLAELQEAALLAQNKDVDGARAIYRKLQGGDNALFRDLAVLLEAMVVMKQEALPIDSDHLRQKLQPLTTDGNPWRYSARELSALLAWRAGQTQEAKELLTRLAADALTPSDMRNRAQQLLSRISG